MFAIIVAGVPEWMDSAFTRRLRAVLKERSVDPDVEIFWSPVPTHEARSYSAKYCERLYHKLQTTIAENESKSFVQAAAVLAVDYDNQALAPLQRTFFPEVPVIPLEPDAVRNVQHKPNHIEGAANELLLQIVKKLKLIQRLRAALYKEVTSRANNTPVLLPLQHFQSEGISDLLAAIERQFTANGDAFQILASLTRPFENQHKKAIGGRPGRHFVNASSLVFARPGKDLHPVGSGNHPDKCYVSIRLRLGARFTKDFHYDCTHYRGAASLPRGWTGCHTQPFMLPKDRQHINIAPNGACR